MNCSQSYVEPVATLSYLIGLCSVKAEAQGVVSYSEGVSYSPWYLLRQLIR